MESLGVPADRAALVADSLVFANLRGVDSHGVCRLLIYAQRIAKGVVDPKAGVRVVHETAGTLLIDGQNGLGQFAGVATMDLAIAKAKQSGVAFAGVRNSNHFGTGAYFVMRALPHGMIGLALSNAPSTMAPWGGITPYIGTNPLAAAIPAGEEKPVIMDMATSVVARGKIIEAAKQGKPIPLGWAQDAEGRPTTDAAAALVGAVLPFGGPKGYAISVLIDIFSGVLTGAAWGPHIRTLYDHWDEPQNVGHFFAAINVASFMEPRAFHARMDQMIREIKAGRRAAGVDEILLPGEPEFRIEEARRRDGIPLPGATVDELTQVGEMAGVPFARWIEA